MSYLPLNGHRVIGAVERALSGAQHPATSTAELIRHHLGSADARYAHDAPDGTGAATKSYGPAVDPADDRGSRGNRAKPLAVDPSQGHGSNSPRAEDPLLAALRDLPTMQGVF